ncbi:hypothetical protein [Bacillus gobiensis]|uniref:hypothetical protein n=1 Tax=Bacillus gobiensis TaxID=1441095 RepID=UPI003D19212E
MMKLKIITGVVTASLITGTGVYSYNQHVLAEERAETFEKAENAVDSLYNSDRTMLSNDIEKKIRNAESAVEKVEEGKARAQLSEEISKVNEIAKIQQEVYSTQKNGVLIESVTDEQLEEMSKKLTVIKSQNESIYNHLSKYLSEANVQMTAIDAALKKVSEAEKSLNRETYNSALTLVDKVKNEEKKDELKKQLATTNEKLVAKEEEAKRQKEEEAKLAAEKEAEKAVTEQSAAKQQNTVASSSSKSTSSSTTNSGESNTGSTSSRSSKSTSESKQSTPKSNHSNSVSKSPGSTSKPNTSEKKPASNSGGSSGSSSGGTDWDKVGDQLENHDWSNTGSGEIDEGGNTWDSWE